jgi:copper transport protein
VSRKIDLRRSLRAAAIVLGLMAAATPVHAVARTLLHATLLRSTPAANSRLDKPPSAIRLVFSEQVVPELSQIALVGSRGDTVQLKVANDPHDVHVLVGTVTSELTGPYKVVWRVLSADGHPVGGNFKFTVGSGTTTSASSTASVVADGVAQASPNPSPALATPVSSSTGAEEKPVPVFASLFRGIGLGAFMTGIGILFFGLSAGERRFLIPGALVTSLIAGGTLLLVAHAIMWLEHVSPTGHLSADFMSSILGSAIGRVELLRVLLAVLALWAISLARHRKIALWLGIGCLIVSGAVGHPAAIHPYVAIPAKMTHLLAASIWVGGLVWLVWVAHCDEAACRIEARRVSSIALIAVIAIFLSGLLQIVLFLNTPSDLWRDDYGRLVLAKIVGLLILVGYGVYNRFGLLPTLETPGASVKLQRSAKQEIAIVAIVILIGGFLAYVPTPPIPQSASTAPAGATP